MMTGFPASCAYPATCLSCSRIPASASIRKTATSQDSIADSARSTEGSGLGLAIAASLCKLQNIEMILAIDGDLFKVSLIFFRNKDVFR